jgi:iron-sulfur cluster repair protein YtfE (RIC family)
VRRHAALVLLSNEHHHELVHARRLRRAAGAGPEQRLAVASAYIDAFFTETVEHFRREEEILFPLYRRYAGSTPVLERILREHMELQGLVRALRAARPQATSRRKRSTALARSRRSAPTQQWPTTTDPSQVHSAVREKA